MDLITTEILFTIGPIIYMVITIGLVYLFFRILNGIRKSNLERNELLRSIHEELKKQRSEKY